MPFDFNAAVDATVAQASGPPLPAMRKDGPSGRFYEIDGERYPSVTHILSVIAKPALIQWAAKEERTLVSDTAADLYLDAHGTPAMSRLAFLTTLQTRLGKQRANQKMLTKAGEIGSQVHALIEWNLRQTLGQQPGPEPRVVDDARWAFMAFEDWRAAVDLKPIWIEQTVFSKTHRYAGTMDLYAEVAGVPTVIDFKTGKAVYAEAHLQNAAYQAAFAEMGHGEPAQGLIVRLPKVQTDPAFEVVTVRARDELLTTFVACASVWRWWHANEEAYRAKRNAAA